MYQILSEVVHSRYIVIWRVRDICCVSKVGSSLNIIMQRYRKLVRIRKILFMLKDQDFILTKFFGVRYKLSMGRTCGIRERELARYLQDYLFVKCNLFD